MTTFVNVCLAASVPDNLKAAAILDLKGNSYNSFWNVCLKSVYFHPF